MVGTGNDAFAGLQRLAKRIEHGRRKFRQFVEKQDAVMGKRGLTRLGLSPPPTSAAMVAE